MRRISKWHESFTEALMRVRGDCYRQREARRQGARTAGLTGRRLRLLTVTVVMAFLAAACGANAATNPKGNSTPTSAVQRFAGMTLRVATYGGSWQTAEEQYVDQPFEKATGAHIVYTIGYPETYAVPLMAAGGRNPPFDVMYDDDTTQALLIQRGLLEKVPTNTSWLSGISAPAQVPGYTPPSELWYIGLVYNVQQFKKLGIPAPTSWSALWNPKLAGRISIPGPSTAEFMYAVEAAAAVAGKPLTDVTAGVNELAKLRTYSIYSSTTQLGTDLANGNVLLAVDSIEKGQQLQNQGYPVRWSVPKLPGTNQIGWRTEFGADVVKGTPVSALANTYLNFVYGAAGNAGVSQATAYEPTNPAALKSMVAQHPIDSSYWPPVSQLTHTAAINWPSELHLVPIATSDFTKVIGQ